MKARPIFAASLLAASLGLAFTTLAQNQDLAPASWLKYYDLLADNDVPSNANPAPMRPDDAGPPPSESPEALAPASSPAIESPAPAAQDNPPYAEPPITVTMTPEEHDRVINNDVVAALQNDSHLSGKIGVETHRQVVTLTGRVTNPMQSDRAEQIARNVNDVNDVQNLIRARVGG